MPRKPRTIQAQVEPNLSTFKPKHLDLIRLANDPAIKFLMAAGGIRSGKSITLATILFLRAMRAPGSQHGVFHAQANICFRNLFTLTFPETLEILIPGYFEALKAQRDNGAPKYIRISDREIILPNDSKIMFLGLDDPDKIRGQQFSTVWVNEANQVDYSAIMTLQGRLSQSIATIDGSTLDTLFLVDLNPTVKSSWEHQVFVEGVVPGDRTPIPSPERYAWRKINASDNAENLPSDYFETVFGGMSAEQRRRDELGEWSEDNPNALFSLATIGRKAVDPETLTEIVVGVDPAGSSHKASDLTGIVVAGKDSDGTFFVLRDETLRGKPEEWAQRAVDLYREYGANWIVAEKNCGGEMVETVLQRATTGGRGVPVKLVHASRGKRIRAEPIQVLYQQGRVNHVTLFRELEQQMIEFDAPGFKGSPDRVDALVWALTELSEASAPRRTGSVRKIGGFWH
jgi:predicted phage terminase large subunit-like protein